MKIAVIGAGNGGLAMAGHLSSLGFSVNLYNRTAAKLSKLLATGEVQLEGAIKGTFPIDKITTSLAEAIMGSQIIMVTTPASAHQALARDLAPFLEPRQLIVLNPGRTGGALEFRNTLSHFGQANIIVEAQTFIYASRFLGGNSAFIYRIKNQVRAAVLPSKLNKPVLQVLCRVFPQFTASPSVLHTSLDNIGAVFHPAPLMLNASRVESGSDFDYYHEGITPAIARVMEEIDKERLAVCHALGISGHSALTWLGKSYDAHGASLYEAIRDNTAYCGIKAPRSLNHRYITEDVPTGLVPLASFGRLLGVSTPTCDALISLAKSLTGTDYWETGRTVERLGIAHLSRFELLSYVRSGLVPAHLGVDRDLPVHRLKVSPIPDETEKQIPI